MAPKNVEKRNEILTASYAEFSCSNYKNVSLSTIAERSGINKSLLQHYHSKKSDIMKTLLEELLLTSFKYMESLPYDYENSIHGRFHQISDFDMLFFKAASKDSGFDGFLRSTVGDHEILDMWIDIISSWLRSLCDESTFSYLQLRASICFAMTGSMHLYLMKDELGIDYRSICRNHLIAIMNYLKFDMQDILDICGYTDARCDEFNTDRFLDYCEEKLPWFERT